MSEEQTIQVTEDDDGQRLDRWLKKHAPHMPYGLTQKLIRKGAIRVAGKKVKPDVRLSAGQEIRIPPVEGEPRKKEKKLSEKDIQFIKSLIIHDDGDIIALNKPAGLAVQGGTKTKEHVDGYLQALADEKGVKPRLVHRLDKDTSGVLLLARSAKMAKKLGEAFKGRDVKKIYFAIVTPAPEIPDGTIKAPLAKAGGANKERMVVDEEEGKPAFTEYKLIDKAMDQIAFMAFWPRTGRTHQIRVHAELGGFPILGDNKYRGEGTRIEGLNVADRLHLHAQRIILKHPTQKGMLDIAAPMPDDLKKSWQSLGFDPSFKDDPFFDIKSDMDET